MELYEKQFLEFTKEEINYNNCKYVILPVPYEGSVSFAKGTKNGPDYILDTSYHLELYDEVLKCEPHKSGIATIKPVNTVQNIELLQKEIYEKTYYILKEHKFPIIIGGDHSITPPAARALFDRYKNITVIQLDAHSDLRDSYENSKYSHACAMRRIREFTKNTLQIGMRAISKNEADLIESDNSIKLFTMNTYRQNKADLFNAIKYLPDYPVYLTIDVDVFDWSVIRSTGTPEPGGMYWDEAMELINFIIKHKTVAGFDIVELIGTQQDINSAFAAAKLLYKIIGYIYKKENL